MLLKTTLNLSDTFVQTEESVVILLESWNHLLDDTIRCQAHLSVRF